MAVVWRQLGFNVIIALAGLQQIDNSYYEAAKVDGAGVLDRIRFITLPLLSPTLLFLVVINVIISFQAFGEIDILTMGRGRASRPRTSCTPSSSTASSAPGSGAWRRPRPSCWP